MQPSQALGPTINELLAQRARTHTDQVFLRFASGDLTFAEVDHRSARLATGLASIGVEPGETVPVLMGNNAEFVISLMALSRLGAVACLTNTAFKGPALAHAIGVTQARVVLLDKTVVDNLDEVAISSPNAPLRIVVGDRWDELASVAPAATQAAHSATDPAMVLFTSGTTGTSKGCVLSHRYVVRQAELMVEHLGFVDTDVLYCPFPMFHIDATVLTVGPALVLGATAAIGERFSVSGFWPEVRRFGATVFDFMGATLSMLHKAAPSPDDVDNLVRLAWGVPVPDEIASEFENASGCSSSSCTAAPMRGSRCITRSTNLGGQARAAPSPAPTKPSCKMTTASKSRLVRSANSWCAPPNRRSWPTATSINPKPRYVPDEICGSTPVTASAGTLTDSTISSVGAPTASVGEARTSRRSRWRRS